MRSLTRLFSFILVFAFSVFTPLFALADDAVTAVPDASQEVIASGAAQLIGLLINLMSATAWSSKITGFILTMIGLIGAASVIVKLFEKVAAITPNTKDDEYAHWLAKGLSWVTWVLDKVALNPKVQEAKKAQSK